MGRWDPAWPVPQHHTRMIPCVAHRLARGRVGQGMGVEQPHVTIGHVAGE